MVAISYGFPCHQLKRQQYLSLIGTKKLINKKTESV